MRKLSNECVRDTGSACLLLLLLLQLTIPLDVVVVAFLARAPEVDLEPLVHVLLLAPKLAFLQLCHRRVITHLHAHTHAHHVSVHTHDTVVHMALLVWWGRGTLPSPSLRTPCLLAVARWLQPGGGVDGGWDELCLCVAYGWCCTSAAASAARVLSRRGTRSACVRVFEEQQAAGGNGQWSCTQRLLRLAHPMVLFGLGQRLSNAGIQVLLIRRGKFNMSVAESPTVPV